MKIHRNTSTIAIYFLFTLLWLTLFLNASNKIEIEIKDLDAEEARMDWFNNLDQLDKDNAIQLLSQGIQQYNGLRQDLLEDMETKFRIIPAQTQQLYEFLYSTKNTNPSSDVYVLMVVDEKNLPKNDTAENIDTEDIYFELYTNQSEIEKIVKEITSLEKYKVKEDEPRTVPIFTTFDYRESKGQVKDILIELKENEAMNLYLFSELFKNMIDAPSQKPDNDGYCQRTYGDNSVVDQHQMYDLKVEACKAIRSIDFSVNSLLIANVHSTHMKMIMEFVNKKDGVPPPEVGYIKEVTDSEIQLGDDMSTLGNFDLNFVEKIWNHDKNDVDYVLMAATYLKITCLSQLMGARVALGIKADFDNIKYLTLGYDFLKY